MLKVKTKVKILQRMKEITEKEGANVTKEFIYGDKLYEEIFKK